MSSCRRRRHDATVLIFLILFFTTSGFFELSPTPTQQHVHVAAEWPRPSSSSTGSPFVVAPVEPVYSFFVFLGTAELLFYHITLNGWKALYLFNKQQEEKSSVQIPKEGRRGPSYTH